MIVDAFTYNGEADLLEIRLNTLGDVVDKFVLVEANKTFSGQQKPLAYLRDANESRFAKWPIVFVSVTDMPLVADAWSREYHQRNAITRGLEGVPDDAVVLISDVDEIPSASAVVAAAVLVNAGEVLPYLEMSFFYYSMQHAMPGRWNGTRAASAGTVRKHTPQWCRPRGTVPLPSSGWHFSYLGDVAYIQKKLAAFSHQEFNRPPFNERGHIQAQRDHAVDFLRGQRLRVIDGTTHLPPYVIENLDRFGKYLANADKVSAQ